ncbi:MAG: universal stress protein [Verrucomicrobiales bacterium]
MNKNRLQALTMDARTSKDHGMHLNAHSSDRPWQIKKENAGGGLSKEWRLNSGAILVPIDFTNVSAEALEIGLSVAKRCNWSITLLHVIFRSYAEGFIDSSAKGRMREEAHRRAQRKLKMMAFDHRSSGVPILTMVRSGLPEYEILKVAEKMKPEMILLVRQRRHPLSRFIFGSVTEDILEVAKCPVLVVNDGVESEGLTGIAGLVQNLKDQSNRSQAKGTIRKQAKES